MSNCGLNTSLHSLIPPSVTALFRSVWCPLFAFPSSNRWLVHLNSKLHNSSPSLLARAVIQKKKKNSFGGSTHWCLPIGPQNPHFPAAERGGGAHMCHVETAHNEYKNWYLQHNMLDVLHCWRCLLLLEGYSGSCHCLLSCCSYSNPTPAPSTR